MALINFEDARLPQDEFVRDVFNVVRDYMLEQIAICEYFKQQSSAGILMMPAWETLFNLVAVQDLYLLSEISDLDNSQAVRCASYGLALYTLTGVREQCTPKEVEDYSGRLQAVFNKHSENELWELTRTNASKMAYNSDQVEDVMPVTPEDKVLHAIDICGLVNQYVTEMENASDIEWLKSHFEKKAQFLTREDLPESLYEKMQESIAVLKKLGNGNWNLDLN